jgi:hypothetical protein
MVLRQGVATTANLRLSALQHVEDAHVPLIAVIKGREVFRRVHREFVDFDALDGSGLRNRGS